MILCAGGLLSNLVLVPLIWFVGSHLDSAVYPAAISDCEDDGGANLPELCTVCGVGAIATAGIFGIVKSLRVVAVRLESRCGYSGRAKRRRRSGRIATFR